MIEITSEGEKNWGEALSKPRGNITHAERFRKSAAMASLLEKTGEMGQRRRRKYLRGVRKSQKANNA